MADNVTLNSGAGGDSIAADDIAGVKFQRVKVTLGADGVNGGDVSSANPVPAVLTASTVNIGDVDVLTGPTGASALQGQGTAAHDAAVVGNPVLVGGYASATAPTSVAAGDAVRSWHGLDGSTVISDGGGQITVDGTVTANLSAGTNTNEVVGDVAEDAALAGNPLGIGVRASTAVPTPVSADNDSVRPWATRIGALQVGIVDSAGDSCIDATNNAVQVNVVAGSAAGTEYTEGATDGTISGPAIMWEDTSDTLRPVSAAKPLPVNVVAGGTSGVQYTEGDVDSTITGTAAMWETAGNVLMPVSAANPLPVSLTAGTNTNEVVGDVAEDATLAGNPVRIGVKASDAVPSAMSADGDVVTPWHDRRGAAMSRIVDSVGDSCMDDANNALRVNIIAGAGSGGTAMADEGAFTEGTTSFTPVGGVFNDTISSDPTEDQAAAARITAKRGLHVNLRNTSGTEVGTSGAPVRTDPTGSTTQPVSGTITANAGTNLNTSALALETGGNLAGAATSLAIIDDWDETDRAKVNTIVGQVGVQGGSGAVSANTQRVVLATDVGLPAGTNNIGDMDVLSLPGGLTGKAEDSVAVSADVGLPVLAVRRDSASSGVSADGDYANLSVDSNGNLRVVGGTAGTEFAEDSAHTTGALGSLALGVRQDADTSPVSADGDYHAPIFDNAGNLKVTVKAVSGSKADDTVFNVDSDSVSPTGYLVDETGTDTVTEGNVGVARMTADRKQLVRIVGATDTSRLEIDSSGQASVNLTNVASGVKVEVQGDVAHDAAVAGNPLLMGAEARDTLGTAVATGDACRIVTDRYGRLQVTGPEFTLASSDNTPITTATETTAVAAPGASTHLRVYYVHTSNSSATVTDTMWRDGAAGARRYRATLPQYGQHAHNIKPGYWDLTSNTALVITTSAAGSVHWTCEYEVVAD